MAAAPSPNPSASTGSRRWLWLVLGAAVLLVAALYGYSRFGGRVPGLSGADGDKRAAIHLCWKEQADLPRGQRLEGGACDKMERLFMPKIDAQAYGGS